jgi:hypothetical protein
MLFYADIRIQHGKTNRKLCNMKKISQYLRILGGLTHIDDVLAFFKNAAKSRRLFISIKHKQTINSTKNIPGLCIRLR